MLNQIGKRSVLLWFSREELSNAPWQARENPMGVDPLFITEAMIDQLRDLVMDVVIARPSSTALAQGRKGMIFPPMQAKAAADMLGLDAHAEAAAVLAPRLKAALNHKGSL